MKKLLKGALLLAVAGGVLGASVVCAQEYLMDKDVLAAKKAASSKCCVKKAAPAPKEEVAPKSMPMEKKEDVKKPVKKHHKVHKAAPKAEGQMGAAQK